MYLIAREKAIHCFKKSHNKDGLATAHYMTEDFDELWKVTEGASDKKLLFRIGEMFESVGMCDEAVHCFVNVSKLQSMRKRVTVRSFTYQFGILASFLPVVIFYRLI